jgi:hypothetical protein
VHLASPTCLRQSLTRPRAGMHPRPIVRCTASSWTKGRTRRRVKVLSRGRAGIRSQQQGCLEPSIPSYSRFSTPGHSAKWAQASSACGVRADTYPVRSVGHLGMRLRVVSKWLPLRLQSRKAAITESSRPPFLLLLPALLPDGLPAPLLPEHAH